MLKRKKNNPIFLVFVLTLLTITTISCLGDFRHTNSPQLTESNSNYLIKVNNQTRSYLGTNLSKIADWSTEMPFLDAFKSSRRWITQCYRQEKGCTSSWNTKEYEKLELDEYGWVKSLPAPEEPPEYTRVSTLMFKDVRNYPEGRYLVLYEGEGTIEYKFDAQLVSSTPGRDVINVTPSKKGILLTITATDPQKTGNYIRNIHVVKEEYEETFKSEVFNPQFIDKINKFKALRFMDWMDTNNSTQNEWENRPKIEQASYSYNGGVPVEIMVELANRLDIDPWFTMPHLADDEYITNFAQYVRDHLEPERKVYVEYSNEAWNRQFKQASYVKNQGRLEWPDSSSGDVALGLDWYSKRTTEITRIWDQVFGEDKDRVIGIMGAQAVSTWTAKQVLSYAWASNPLPHKEYGIDAIAIGPYFGGYIGRSKHEAEVQSWTKEADGGLNKLFDELTKGGVLTNGPESGALQQAYDSIKKYVQLANQENLELLAYEGGQHLVGVGRVVNNQDITNLFIDANRDPRMGEIYYQYLTKWYELGGGLFMNFSSIGKPSKWGSWGALEYIEQQDSPKYNALIDFIQQNSATK